MSSILSPRNHAGALAALAADEHLDPLAEPGVATVCGDWHGQIGAARWALRRGKDHGAGVWLHVGDMGVWPGGYGAHYLDRLSALLEHHEAILLFVDGNHEDHDQLEAYPLSPRTGLRCVRPRLYHLPRGFRWQWSGRTWMALGGATSPDRPTRTVGVDWWPQEGLTYGQALAAASAGEVDVMLTHDAPAGVNIPGLDQPGPYHPDELAVAAGHRDLLQQVVEEVRPATLIHGHYHRRYTAPVSLEGGGTCTVTGLHKDGTGDANLLHLTVADLPAHAPDGVLAGR